MAEYIVKDVRLLQIIHLRLRSNEGSGWEAPVGQVIEEDIVGDKLCDRDDATSGVLFKPIGHLFDVGDAGFGQLERIHHYDEFIARAVPQDRLRPLEQAIPKIVLLS